MSPRTRPKAGGSPVALRTRDIADLAIPTLAHRVLLSPAAQLAGRNPADAVAAAIATVAVPARR